MAKKKFSLSAINDIAESIDESTNAKPEEIKQSAIELQSTKVEVSAEEKTENPVKEELIKKTATNKKNVVEKKKNQEGVVEEEEIEEKTIGVNLPLPQSIYVELQTIRMINDNIPMRRLVLKLVERGLDDVRKNKFKL